MKVRKLVVSDGRTERELLLVGTIVVGRDPSCQLNDLDPLLSRRHAEFVPTSKGVTIRDLNSRNGILVNGDKVPEHALKPGDVIQLGHLHVRYVEEPVVKSPEDHTRIRAKTETGIEVPTMAPMPRKGGAPAPAPLPAPVSLSAPTETAPTIAASDDTDLDVTIAPLAREAASRHAPAPPSASSMDDSDLDATVAPMRRPTAAPVASAPAFHVDDDLDVTVAPAARRVAAAPAPASRHDDDTDATRMPWAPAPASGEDADATTVSIGLSFDATRAPAVRPHLVGSPARSAPVTEACVVANDSLVITEASPSCQTVIGARPDTIVGGQLADAIARTLTFVATGDGPSALSLSIVRATSGTITVTFKAGQTEKHS